MLHSVWKKFLLLTAICALAGCGADNDEAGQNRDTVPIGYYSNENHDNGRGFFRHEDDNDGPLTEIMDHTFGKEGTAPRPAGSRQQRDANKKAGETTEYIEKTTASAKSVPGVEDAAVIFSGNRVLVAVRIADGNRTDKIRTAVEKQVRDRLNVHSLTVVADKRVYERVKRLENELRNGKVSKQVREEIENMLRFQK